MAITNLSHVREDWGKVEIGQENFSENTWHQTKIWPHPYHGFISPAFGLFDTDSAILFYDTVRLLDYLLMQYDFPILLNINDQHRERRPPLYPVILRYAQDLSSACTQILRCAQDDNARRMTGIPDLDWE